jgi:hypothetical protein
MSRRTGGGSAVRTTVEDDGRDGDTDAEVESECGKVGNAEDDE